MKSSEIIKRARSLCDISTASFISNSDELNSIHESWKDIYEKISESSDDYFVKTVELDMASAVKLDDYQYEVIVPVDCWKIRYVDYLFSGKWINMTKFNTNNRNNNGISSYRWKGSKLWISGVLPAGIRLTYFPVPITPSVPDLDYQYGYNYTDAQSILLSSPYFFSRSTKNQVEVTDYMLFQYNKTLVIESTKLNKAYVLYTSTTGIKNIKYNSGYIYFIENGNIMKAVTDYSTTIVPVAITSSNDITNFSITNNVIYYCNGVNTYVCNLDGTEALVIDGELTLDSPELLDGNIDLVYNFKTKDVYYCNDSIYYIKSDNFIYKDDISMNISAKNLVVDTQSLYYLDTNNVLKKYINDLESAELATDIKEINGISNDYIASITITNVIKGISSKEDTDFNYPVNESNEIMAYQCAIDFNRKQKGDITTLTLRLNELIARFERVLIRDSYQPERRSPETFVNNYY